MSGIFTVTIGEENGMPSVALAIAGVFRPDSDVSQMVTNIVGALFPGGHPKCSTYGHPNCPTRPDNQRG